MIAAMDINNAIGFNNQLLWHLPDDFKWFKENTKGKPMIMGRNTMVSLGKPLPNRINIVISTKNENIIEGFIYAYNIEDALCKVPPNSQEVMIIGGGKIYAQMLSMADILYITKVNHACVNADTFFPYWHEDEWKQVYNVKHDIDEKHAYSFDFLILEKIMEKKTTV